MNDDLEQDLYRLQPAVPPPALLRRLKATPPPVRLPWWQRLVVANVGRDAAWRLAALGTCAVLVVFLLRSVVSPGNFSGKPLPADQLGAASSPCRQIRPLLLAGSTDFSSPVGTAGSAQVEQDSTVLDQTSRCTALGSAALRVDLSDDRAGLNLALLSFATDHFDLEVPTGPIRLNCGGLPLVNDGSAQAFESLTLPLRTRF